MFINRKYLIDKYPSNFHAMLELMANVMSNEKCAARFAGVLLSLLSVVFLPLAADSYLLKDDAHGTQLSIFGLGMIRLNYATLNGDGLAYEDSEGGFLDGFDTQEFLALTATGMLWRDYALDSEVRYNPDDDPDWHVRVKVSRDENYLLFGDQPNIFAQPYFTRYASPFRGLTLHVQDRKDTFEVTTFAAFSRGSSEKEELIPDGTSGPYQLQAIPIVPGSETITIEVRSRNDNRQVIEIIPQQRNVDYTIAYDTGKIKFARPIDNETFRGDPVVLVVNYRSETGSAAFETALVGARAAVSPTGWANVGVTYLSEFSRDPSVSDGFQTRREIYSLDNTLKLGDAFKLNTEYAFSRNHAEDTNASALTQAVRAKLDGNLGEQITLTGKYERAERDFLTFANPDIKPNEQELDLAGKYFYRPKQSLEAGYRFWQDNLPRAAQTPTVTTHQPYIGWDAYLREQTEVFAKYELFRTKDDQPQAITDKQTQTLLVGGVQEFQRVPALKKLVLRGEYQLTDFDDHTAQERATLTHQIGLQAKAEPVKNIAASVEQRERLIHDKELGENTQREDISEIGLELKRWERFAARTKYQYKVAHDLLADTLISEMHTLTVSSEYKPWPTLTSAGKFEIRDETFYAASAAGTTASQIISGKHAARTLNAEGRLLYNPLKDFSAKLRYEYQKTEDQAEAAAITREDTLEFIVNYAFDRRKTRLTGAVKLERDLLEAPPTPQTETHKTTYLASAVRQISDRWDILAQYKRELSTLATENSREDMLGEIGYNAGRFVKIVGGYQYTRLDDQTDASKDYTANSVYLKLIGKL